MVDTHSGQATVSSSTPHVRYLISSQSSSVCFRVCLLPVSPEEEVIQHLPASSQSEPLCIHLSIQLLNYKPTKRQSKGCRNVVMKYFKVYNWHLPDKCYSVIFPDQACLNHGNMKELFPKRFSIWFSKLPTVTKTSALIGTALHLNERGKGSKHYFSSNLYKANQKEKWDYLYSFCTSINI